MRQRSTIRAELIGSTTCTTAGITVNVSSPVLALCRALVEAGHDPTTPLHAYRGATLCLTVRSIGEAAGLEVNSAGSGFIGRRGLRSASQVRSNGWAATGCTSEANSERELLRARMGRPMTERRRLPNRRFLAGERGEP